MNSERFFTYELGKEDFSSLSSQSLFGVGTYKQVLGVINYYYLAKSFSSFIMLIFRGVSNFYSIIGSLIIS